MTVSYPLFDDEAERIEALRALELLDTPREERFDRITRTAARLVDSPIALISLVDSDRQWFKSCQGLGISETDRSASFCTHALGSDELFVVEDAQHDARFADNPLVTGPPHVRFYAGKPLRSSTGHRLGTLCVIDRRPRKLSPEDRAALSDVAAWAELEINLVAMSRAATDRDRLRRRLTSVLQSIAQGICLLDADQRLMAANDALEEMAQVGRGNLEGRHLADVFVDLRGQPLSAPAADGEVPALLVRAAAPTPLEVVLSAAPLREEEATTVLVVTDVSEQRSVERLKDGIISVTAHELRTPLTAIRGSLGLLRAGVGGVDAAAERLVDTAVRNTDRLIRLVNDMLDLERIAAGRMPMREVPVDLAQVVRAAVDNLAPAASAAEVAVQVDLHEAWVTGDEDRLTQVAVNLIDNAVKFSDRGGEVSVRVARRPEVVVLSVSDSGPGLTEAEAERVFERFVRVGAADRGGVRGTGLGLAIVRGIVDQHDGSIAIDSRPGAGATFEVRLPGRPTP